MSLLVNSIYRATEGEGVNIGTPQVFIRIQGCPIGCLNCDSKDTWEFTESMRIELSDIMKKVKSEAGLLKRVSITGGEPLHPKHEEGLTKLVKLLKADNFFINIEASGTRVVDHLFKIIDFISFDYKTPSTGVKTNLSLIEKMVSDYKSKFQIKSVIETKADFDDVMKAYKSINDNSFYWCLTPSYNLEEEFPNKRFQDVINWNEEVGGIFRVIGQQHKWIHGPDKKQI